MKAQDHIDLIRAHARDLEAQEVTPEAGAMIRGILDRCLSIESEIAKGERCKTSVRNDW